MQEKDLLDIKLSDDKNDDESEPWEEEFGSDEKSLAAASDDLTATPLSLSTPSSVRRSHSKQVLKNKSHNNLRSKHSHKEVPGELKDLLDYSAAVILNNDEPHDDSNLTGKYTRFEEQAVYAKKPQMKSFSLDSFNIAGHVKAARSPYENRNSLDLRSTFRESESSSSGARSLYNINNASFLLSKYKETNTDDNFEDIFEEEERPRTISSEHQRFVSGLSKSSDHSFNPRDDRDRVPLRSVSNEYFDSSPLALPRQTQKQRGLISTSSVYKPSESYDVSRSLPSGNLVSSVYGPRAVPQQLRHPFNRLGMITEDKDSADMDLNDDFEIDPSLDFNEKLDKYRNNNNNAVSGSSSSSQSIGRASSGSSKRAGFNSSFYTSTPADMDDDYDEFDDEDSYESGGDNLAGKLRQRMQLHRKDQEFDEFINIQFDEKDFRQDGSKDVHSKRSREIVDIMGKIRPETKEKLVIEYCEKLMELFSNYPEQREHLITYHGVMPIIDMFEARTSAETKTQGGKGPAVRILRPYVLRVINKIIEGSIRLQEQISLVGLIPTIMNLFERSCKTHQQSNYANTPYSMIRSNSADRVALERERASPGKGMADSFDHVGISMKTNNSAHIVLQVIHLRTLHYFRNVLKVSLHVARGKWIQ